MSNAELQSALNSLKTGNFAIGKDWENAHEICQAHEGKPLFDWTHALVHRIERDERNAGYWYRRAAKDPHAGSFEDEWHDIQVASEQA